MCAFGYITNDDDREKLSILYKRVFNDDNTIKACGRDACRDLIIYMEQLSGGRVKVGDSETGMMNISKLQTTYEIMTDPFR